MSKVMFFCIPAVGHLNPQIALANALVKKGEQVIFFTTPMHGERVKKSGAEVRVVDTKRDIQVSEFAVKMGTNMLTIGRFVAEYTLESLPQVFPQVLEEKPDYIVHDLITLEGRICARANKIPAVCTIPVFAFQERTWPKAPLVFAGNNFFKALPHLHEFIRYAQICGYLAKKYGVTFKDLVYLYNDYGDLDIIGISKYFQFFPELYTKEKYKFVGPMLLEEREEETLPVEKLKGKKVIYISLGTAYNNNPKFYRECFKAFKDTEYVVVMSMKSGIRQPATGIPNNFIVMDYVPQLKALKYADIFVTHAGMNSVMEGYYNDVPLVCAPQAMDQIANARRAAQLKAAICLTKPNAKKLRKAVEKVLSDPVYRENAVKIGKSLREAGGVDKAVEYIIKFKKELGIPD